MHRFSNHRMSPIFAALFATLALSVLAPAAALAEVSNPFGGANPSQQEEAEKAKAEQTKASTSTSKGLPSDVVIGGLAVAGLLLAGIAYMIVRDARGLAPVGDGPTGGPSSHAAARLRKRRAKAKQARRQRKRNR